MRPLRFGTGANRPTDHRALTDAARDAERFGYSTFGLPDHFMIPLAPLIALQAAAEATTTVRLAQIVLNQDLRHPAVVAKELATLDVLSDGRVEVGIGAGWMREEYAQAGITYDTASVRIERLVEYVVILQGLFADEPFSFSGEHFEITALDGTPKPRQRPRPPIMIGGGGPKLLSVAARHADIVQIMPVIPNGKITADLRQFTAETYEQKVGCVREAAGARFEDLELSVQLLNVTITDRPHDALETFLDGHARMVGQLGGSLELGGLTSDELLASPVVAIGTVEQICEKLLDNRARFGFSYFAAPVGSSMETLAPVIERLAGT